MSCAMVSSGISADVRVLEEGASFCIVCSLDGYTDTTRGGGHFCLVEGVVCARLAFDELRMANLLSL